MTGDNDESRICIYILEQQSCHSLILISNESRLIKKKEPPKKHIRHLLRKLMYMIYNAK